MFSHFLVTVVLAGALALEVGTGTAFFYWSARNGISWPDPPVLVTRGSQPVGYWLLVAAHTAFAGLVLAHEWAPGLF